MQPLHYTIKKNFAKRQNRPVTFVAIQIKETDKAVYLWGQQIKNRKPNGTAVNGWFPKRVIVLKRKSSIDLNIPQYIKDEIQVKAENKKIAFIRDRKIVIKFPYNPETVNQIKSLPISQRKYMSEGKYWIADIRAQTFFKLRQWGFEIQLNEKDKESGIWEIIMDGMNLELENKKTPKEIIDNLPIIKSIPGLKANLYDYQKVGVSYLNYKNGRALIGDDMGLGKTLQSLAWLQLHKDKRPVIIITPASLKLNWKAEIEQWMGVTDIDILEGQEPRKIKSNIVIINYDILRFWAEEIIKINPQVIITDECHKFKNSKAKRTKAVKKIAKGVPHFIALSGTPIESKPIEIYNAWSIIDPDNCPNYFDFGKMYCDGKVNGFGWDFSGASNTEELHDRLCKSMMIRRRKSEVLKDLPDKVRSFVPMEIDNTSEYMEAERNLIEYLKKTKGGRAAEKAQDAEHLVYMNTARQLAAKGKIKSVINWINDFLESGEKLIVFAHHKEVISRLWEEFKTRAVKIDGSTPVNQRKGIEQIFQNDPSITLIICQFEAGGTGFTLTAASNVAAVEFPWNPGILEQAIDRAHRIGQKFTVTAWYLLAKDTIEDDLIHILNNKIKVLGSVLDGKNITDKSVISELIDKFKI